MEGQKAGRPGLGAEGALHIGIDHKYFLQLPPVVAVQQQGPDLPGPGHGGVLGGVEEAALNGDTALGEIVPAIFPHHEELRVRVLVQQVLGLPENILVIGPRQALIRRNDQAPVGAGDGLLALLRVEVAAVHALGGGAEDPLDLRLHGLEIGAGVVQLASGLLQLGGGDEVHGVGDLPRLPHALHVGLDLLQTGHIRHRAFRPADGTAPGPCGRASGSPPGPPGAAGRCGQCAGTGRGPAPPGRTAESR